jgi:hypothetical protein
MQLAAADSAVSIAAVDFDSALVAVGDQNQTYLIWGKSGLRE